VHDCLELKEDAANLGAFLFYLREHHPRYYSRIVDTVRLVAPFVASFVLDPVGDKIILRWAGQGTDRAFSAHQLSDGTLRAIALIAVLLSPAGRPNLIIVDEPELGLHPYAMHIVAGLLKAAALETQIIIATQSPTLLDEFEPEHVIVAERHGRESRLCRLDAAALKDWLKEYTLSELWEKKVLGGRPIP
jgi:predicted ATPase